MWETWGRPGDLGMPGRLGDTQEIDSRVGTEGHYIKSNPNNASLQGKLKALPYPGII